ncbi:hypothetical protein NJ7G_0123 [Natrinema sp. J7-2]|nr:hypothetical protein NJ7G_0123 [Natrinema sp. J7-2]
MVYIHMFVILGRSDRSPPFSSGPSGNGCDVSSSITELVSVIF